MRKDVLLCIAVLLLLGAVVISHPPAITGGVSEESSQRVIVILKPGLSGNGITGSAVADEPSMADLQDATAAVQETVLEDVNSPGPLESAMGANSTNDVEPERTLETLPVMVVEATPEGIQKLKEHPLVEAVYSDVAFSLSLAESVPLIKADKVNQITIGGVSLTGEGIATCVIDTGIQADHPAFQNRVVNQKCYCTPNCCPNGQSEDSLAVDVNSLSHGTHVSGIIAANGQYKGVAPGSNIVAVKVCSNQCQLSDIIAGIDYCVTNKDAYNIKIISGSFGDSGNYQSQSQCPTFFDTGIDAAYNAGIVSVFAAGNNNYANGVSYPACAPHAIAVGASDKNDAMASFTNRGPLLAVLAPGVSITSTIKGNMYGILSGTSQSTPHVSGVVALLMQYAQLAGKTVTPGLIKQALMSSGVSISSGYPRVDAMAALEFLGYESDETNATNTTLNVSIVFPADNATVLSNGTVLAAEISGNLSAAVVNWSSNNSGLLGAGLNITVNLTPGIHTIFADASSGNLSASANISISVIPSNDSANSSNSTPLIVSIASPSPDSTVYSNGTNLTAVVTGNSSGVIVTWTSNNSGVLATGIDAFVNLSAGSHTITATADDGNQSANASVRVSVIDPAFIILVSILSPASNATLLTNGTLLSAESSPDSSISWLSNNSGNIANSSNVTVNLSAGLHRLTAIASLGNDSGNASVNVSVIFATCLMDIDLNKNNESDVGDMILLLTNYTSNTTSCTVPGKSGCMVDLDQNGDKVFNAGDIISMLTKIILGTLADIFGKVC